MQAKDLIKEVLGFEVAEIKSQEVLRQKFFAKKLSVLDLKKIHDFVAASSVQTLDNAGNLIAVPAALKIGSAENTETKSLLLLTQVHGNEPGGLAGILLAIVLAEAQMLNGPVYAVIGNNRAANQYFAALTANPNSPQETRDQFRAGIDEQGKLLRDLNRIPRDFKEQDPSDPYIERIMQIYALSRHVASVLDIHTARGDLTCITDYRDPALLRHSPIRNILTGTMEAISGHTSTFTFKTILDSLENITAITGIEAGKHEDPNSIRVAAEFTLAMLYNLGLTSASPLMLNDDGKFSQFRVGEKITFGGLIKNPAAASYDSDLFYPVKPCVNIEELPKDTSEVIVKQNDGRLSIYPLQEYRAGKVKGALAYAVYQFAELERIEKDQVICVGVPSETELKAPRAFNVLFITKSGTLYNDPAVGPWPVKAADLDKIKFTYPCQKTELIVDF